MRASLSHDMMECRQRYLPESSEEFAARLTVRE
jgi:hypothetical protein